MERLQKSKETVKSDHDEITRKSFTGTYTCKKNRSCSQTVRLLWHIFHAVY